VQAPSLHEVQRLFWESVATRPGRHSIAPAFVRMVRGCDDSDRRTRIQIYSDAYFLRLRDVLREDFLRVAALLGADRFDRVVAGYLEEFPSEQPSVRHVGRALAGFLRSREDLPKCLADLAQLEWARIEVFDAPDAECANIEDLVSVRADDWPALRFGTIPALQTLRVQYPVHQLWSDDEPLEMSAVETSLRVWRKSDSEVLHAPMDARESAALSKLISGESFAAICESFADLPEAKAAQETIELLLRWIEDGIIRRVCRPDYL
jgi:hypothetical protein